MDRADSPMPVVVRRMTLSAALLAALVSLVWLIPIPASSGAAREPEVRRSAVTLRPVEVGAHFASLRWAAAADFDAYRVVYRAVNRGAKRTVLTVHRSRVRLQGLRADQAYVVHVRGVRRHGADEGPQLTPLASSRLETADAPDGGTTEVDPAEPGRAWLSGATLAGNVDAATFGDWRGSEMTITGTWNDNYESQVAQWSLRPGYYAGGWTQDLDNAVGAIYKDRGESWHEAAEGAYDDRWASALQNMASLWSGRPGTMYIRFAHEFNGDWYPWSVTRDEIPDFKRAFARFKALKDRYFPDSKLVFCPTSDTAPSFGADWREAFPGTSNADVIAVDYYNQWPFVSTREEFEASLSTFDQWGGPRGLERHRQFAESQGLPFAVAEWSSNAAMGDSPVFMHGFFDWLEAHAGTGPGEVLYEILFNVGGYDEFAIFPVGNQPLTSDTYRTLW